MARKERQGRGKVARVLHVFAIVVRALGLLTFGGSILLMLSLELAPVRRWVVRRVDDVLASTFAGKVVIESVDQLGIGGVRGARIRVSDPGGIQVLWVDGASVRVSLVSTLRSILVGKGDMVIDLAEVNLGYVDANLDADAAGQLRLASAFEPRDKTPSQPSSRKTAIALGRIQLAHAWLHGQPSGAPLVDADIDRLAAKAHIGSEQIGRASCRERV